MISQSGNKRIMRRAKPYSMTRTSPSMKDLNSLTIVELKKILKEQNLTVSGNKPELISRIEEFQDNFLAIDDGETTSAALSNPAEDIAKEVIEKKEIHCRSCNGVLRYPTDYHGTITCPRCKYSFSVKPNLVLGTFLTLLPFISLLLTIVITYTVSENDTTPDGQLGSGMAAAGVCMGGMVLSGIFLAVAMIYAMTRKPVNLG